MEDLLLSAVRGCFFTLKEMYIREKSILFLFVEEMNVEFSKSDTGRSIMDIIKPLGPGRSVKLLLALASTVILGFRSSRVF
jgi:hypothetical protein